MRDQRLWSVQECADIFAESLNSLSKDLMNQGEGGILVWDKVNEFFCEIFDTVKPVLSAHSKIDKNKGLIK